MLSPRRHFATLHTLMEVSMFARIPFLILCCLLLLLAACGPTPTTDSSLLEETGSDTMMDDEAMMDDDDMIDDDTMMDDDETMMGDDDKTMMDDDEAMMDDDDKTMMDDDEAMMDDDDKTMMDDDEAMMDDDDKAMMDLPDWFMTPLTDIHTGDNFTIQDFQGKVVLVETMAIWCSNCLQQQRQVKSLHEELGRRDDFISLAINIDPNEDANALQAYTSRHGFDWLYTVAPVELSRELSQLYGNQILNPPAVPMFIIDRKGEVHMLPFGVKNAQSLQEALQPFLDM
jgi:thiol-disulfide isomerase/thioredoxin